MDWRKVLIGCSIALAVFIVILGVGGFYAYRYFSKVFPGRMLEMPADMKNPSVLTSSGFVSKGPFLKDAPFGNITDIVVGKIDPTPGVEVGVVGTRGAGFLDYNSTVKSSVMFSQIANHVDIIDVDSDGTCEFLERGAWAQDAKLIGHDGNIIWTYGGMPGVDDTAAGDINGDGKDEFVVGFNGGGGVHLLDVNGKKIWREPDGNVWHVEMVDTNGDGTLEIVHSNAAGQIMVRDKDGKVISRAKPAAYFSSFSLCQWPTKHDRQYALLSEDDTIWLFDYDGKVASQFRAPKCGTLGHAWGTPVKLSNDQLEYLAVIVDFENWKRAILYIYDPAKNLVYQEILPESSAAIAAISLDDSGKESLLIGGEGKVWKYQFKGSDDGA